ALWSSNLEGVHRDIGAVDHAVAAPIEGDRILANGYRHVFGTGAAHQDGLARRGAVDRPLQRSRLLLVAVHVRPPVVWSLLLRLFGDSCREAMRSRQPRQAENTENSCAAPCAYLPYRCPLK